MKTNAKKRTVLALSIVLAAVIAVGTSLAYLASTTQVKDNVFTFAENIRAELDEPNWNPKDAEKLTPGYEVRKDPMITNKSDNGIDEFVAIKLTFTDKAGTTLEDNEATRLLKLLEIKWSDKWTLIDGTCDKTDGKVTNATAEQIYAYSEALKPGQVSDPVFSSVRIRPDISDNDFAWLAGIVMTHTDACYTFGAHDPSVCEISYKHHASCAIHGMPGADKIAKEGELGGKKCDCTPAQIHSEKCPSMEGTLKDNCGHTPPPGAICGFQIKTQGAAVQANVEGMDAWDAAATKANLIALLKTQPDPAP